MVAVIYARYSDSKQKEESIEAQLKVCHAHAAKQGYMVLCEYIDRAMSGRTDDRPQFQRMIKDSQKKSFERVIVYRLDRFSRDRYDFAIYMKSLLKNNVKVESATENIPDNSTGIILEAIIGGYNASYSVELAEKIKRNMTLNAEKCLSNGGITPLGYKIENRRYVVDEDTAPIVREIFTKYANGVSIKQICDDLNERQLKSTKGAAFNKSSLHKLLLNRKYLGIYIYDGLEVRGGMPQIIGEALFDRVAQKMIVNKQAPGRTRAKAEYILTTKLFCGYCKSMMIGHSSNQVSRRGVIFNYYKCKNSGARKPCKKKMVSKDYIENRVIEECRKVLSQPNIRRIASEIVKIAKSFNDRSEIKRLEALLHEAKNAKKNHMTSLRACSDDEVRQMIFEDLGTVGAEIKALEKQLEIELARRESITEDQIVKYLTGLAEGDINNIVYRRALIKSLVNKIFLYDETFTITFNTGDEDVTIPDLLLAEIESGLGDQSLCSSNQVLHHPHPKANHDDH